MHAESEMSLSTEDGHQFEVRETLASARRALQVHRDWMRRRNPSISPLPPDAPLSFSPEKRPEPAWDQEDTATGVTSKAAISPNWSLASPVGADREQDLAVAEPGGGAGSNGKWRPRSGKIAPATSSDHPPVSPSQAWREISNPLSVSSQLISDGRRKLGSESVPNMSVSSNDARSRKKRLSRGAVVPLSESSSETNISGSLENHTPVPDTLLGFSMTTPTPTRPQAPVQAWSRSHSHIDSSEAEISTPERHESNEQQHSNPSSASKESPLLGSESRLGQSLPNIPEEMDSNDDNEFLHQTNFSNEGTRNPDQVQEYKQFLQKLQSSSTGTVVSIAPAPKHRQTSYKKHKQSKVGIENDPDDLSDSKSTASLGENGSTDDLTPCSGPTRVLDTKLFEIPQSIILPVLPLRQQQSSSVAPSIISQTSQPAPLSLPLREQVKSPEMKTSLVVASLSEPHEHNVDTNQKQLTGTVQEPSSVDQLVMEDVDEWVPPENKTQPQPTLLVAAPTVPLARNSEKKNLELEDMARPANSPLLRLHGKRKPPSQAASNLGDLEVVDPPSMLKVSDAYRHDPVLVTSARLKPLHSTSINHPSTSEEAPVIQQKNSDEPTPVSKPYTFTVVEEMPRKKRNGKTKSKKMHQDKPVAEKIHEVAEMTSTLVEKLGGQPLNSQDRITSNSPPMPLLRVKSTTSLFIPGEPKTMCTCFLCQCYTTFFSWSDLSSTRKRDRDPPVYSIHSPTGSLAMAPPCPLYGTVQPTDAECEKNLHILA